MIKSNSFKNFCYAPLAWMRDVTCHALLENLIEEKRGAENYPELWLRFAETLGHCAWDDL
jgi:hypothetical protein